MTTIAFTLFQIFPSLASYGEARGEGSLASVAQLSLENNILGIHV